MAINILAQLGLPFLVEVVSGVLRGVKHPGAQSTADALDNLREAINTGGLSAEELTEANRHLEEMTRLKIEEQSKLAGEVNQSLRAEIASNDPYVRRMRPTFGYLMALTWAAQMFGVAYIMIFNTREAVLVIEAIESLGTIWAVALSVLGIYVYKRSDEKKAQSKYIYVKGEGETSALETKPSKTERKAAVYNN